MKNRVTVIVPDQMICVDDEWLPLAFTAPENVRVIQWRKKGERHIEHEDGAANTPVADYDKEVAPFVALFEAEKRRLAELRDAPPTPEEIATRRRAEIMGELAALDSGSVRALRAIQAGTGGKEDERRLREIEDRAAGLRAELAALEADES